jgi:hypothetical protein
MNKLEPKEKAKELVSKFIPYNQEYQEGTDMIFSDDLDGAKQCALICVDEIISAFNFPKYNGDPETKINGDEIYWIDVKQEINKL